MKNKKAAKKVNKFFQYIPDIKDEHKICSKKSPYGDCEDYALTVLYYIANKKFKKFKKLLKSKKSSIVFCTDPFGQLHNLLRYENKYIDNQLQKWVNFQDLLDLGYTRSVGYSDFYETPAETVLRRIKKKS